MQRTRAETAVFLRSESRSRCLVAVAFSFMSALASRPAHADDATAPVGMHFEERTPPALFWSGFGLVAFGYALPPIAFTGDALAGSGMGDSSNSSSSSWGRDAAPWLVPYAGPLLYLETHPKESALWPVTFFAAQVVGTGLLVTSIFVKRRTLVRGEAPARVVSIVPSASRDGGGFRIVGTF